MNRSRLIFIGVAALALGVLASGWAYRDLQERTGASHGGMQDVAVAAADIPVGERIQDKDVRIIQMPSDALPPNGFGSKKRLLGRGAVLPIAQGEFFIAGKNLAAENGGSGLPSMIPAGMRAVSVRVNDGSAVGGFIQPRSRVDVLMTGTSVSGEAQTMTILKNVEVLANGTRLDRTSAISDSQNSPLITLLVSPDDAAKLALAMAQGRIQLALRNPLDTNQAEVAAVGIHSLYPNQKPPVSTLTHARPKAAPVVQAPTPAPTAYPVEVIRGDKRDVTKLPD
jgi:pilus assembly protein CpaB